jgi:hypothetical protein
MFRILSLDGGGIKGTFTASVLAQLEADTQQAVAEHFDLITGTSTGGKDPFREGWDTQARGGSKTLTIALS